MHAKLIRPALQSSSHELRHGTDRAVSPVMRSTLTLGLLFAMSALASSARAEEPTPDRVLGNVDALFGAGFGSVGMAFHAGAGAQAWFGDVFGLGGHAGLIEEDAILGDRSHAAYIGPTVSVRTSGSGPYIFVTAGAGIASRTIQHSSFCIFDPCSRMPAPSHSDEGTDFALSAGAAFHIGVFELGPQLRAESIVGASMLTLNIALGAVVAQGSD
jgi:hypothetical protein